MTYSGQSDGALGAPVTEASNYGTRGLALLDLTGDGRLDRVFADGLTIAAQKADGGYERPTFYGSFDSGSGRYPQIGDLNSDGHNDVITPLGSGEWIILEGRGRTNSMSAQALRPKKLI